MYVALANAFMPDEDLNRMLRAWFAPDAIGAAELTAALTLIGEAIGTVVARRRVTMAG